MEAISKVIIVAAIAASLAACCPRRVAVGSQSTDSVRVVRHTEYVERWHDSVVFIEVPTEVREVIRRDSSLLETSMAESEARILPDGSLYHTLLNKPQTIAMPVAVKDIERIVRDTVEIRSSERIEVPVEKALSGFQKFLMWSAAMFWVGLLCFVIVRVTRIVLL